MITVLLLAGIEKLVNLAISSDAITQAGLTPLSGKVLRLDMQVPALRIDILFNDDHVRFEPVSTLAESVFEPQGGQLSPVDVERMQAQTRASGYAHSLPDCLIKVANPAELLNLMRNASGNLPIEGDYKILMQIKTLISGFNPDIAGQLEPLIGVPIASQLSMLIQHLKASVGHSAQHTFNDVADWANDITGNGDPDPDLTAESNDLKQQLLKLRADVAREEARLAMILAEQAKFKPE